MVCRIPRTILRVRRLAALSSAGRGVKCEQRAARSEVSRCPSCFAIQWSTMRRRATSHGRLTLGRSPAAPYVRRRHVGTRSLPVTSADLSDKLHAALGDAYRIERELTPGGMSRLSQATERPLDRQVVIKLLPPEYASEVSAARLQREVTITAHLQHPHILALLTSRLQAQAPLLRQAVRGGRIPSATAGARGQAPSCGRRTGPPGSRRCVGPCT